MNKIKKIGGIIVDVLIVIVFLISVVLVVANITTDNENGEQANVFGYVINSVQSESMSGTFEKGALVIGKLVDAETVIEKDDIISFRQSVSGTDIINTHRVVATQELGGTTLYQTQGDNREVCPTPDSEWKTIHQVQSVYKFHIPLVGGFIDFLKEPLGFIICLVLPMLAFIGWQVYKLIAIYLQSKKEQMIEEAKEGVSEEAKDAIIREYLAKMQSGENGDDSGDAPTKAPDEPINDDSTASNGDENT